MCDCHPLNFVKAFWPARGANPWGWVGDLLRLKLVPWFQTYHSEREMCKCKLILKATTKRHLLKT